MYACTNTLPIFPLINCGNNMGDDPIKIVYAVAKALKGL